MPATARDYYEVLGVSKTVTDKEIRNCLPEARPQVPSGPEPRRQGRRSQVQRDSGSLRRPCRRREAQDDIYSPVTPGSTPASSSQAPARDRHTDPPTPAPLQAVARRSITTWAARILTSATYSARCLGASGLPETQARPRRGRDVEQPVELTLEEAYAGTTRMVQTCGDGRRAGASRSRSPPVSARLAGTCRREATRAWAAGQTATSTS